MRAVGRASGHIRASWTAHASSGFHIPPLGQGCPEKAVRWWPSSSQWLPISKTSVAVCHPT